MFALLEGTVDQALERRREARRRAMRTAAAQIARSQHELTVLTREGDDEGDWQAAGCTSSPQWVALVCHSDYGTAKRISEVAGALREQPAIDEAMSTGALTLDQSAAALKHATPETDAQIARLAIGKPPGEIALAVRELNPPTVEDDQAVYKRRSLRMKWTPDRSELILSGSLPHELGVVFENAIRDAAKRQRAIDKKVGVVLDWQQSTADALVTLACRDSTSHGGARRRPATVIVHLSEYTPAMLEGGGLISDVTAERHTCGGRIMFIKPQGNDLVHTSGGRGVSDAQMRFLYKRSRTCQYPGCTTNHDLEAHHTTPWALGGQTMVDNLALECPRHHKYIHEHGIRVTGTGANPIYRSPDGRRITATQPHAPPG